jgi:hypothetical protein
MLFRRGFGCLLRTKLVEKCVEAGLPGQEDWGWYLQVRYGTNSYLLGMAPSGNENAAKDDDGEWRIIVEKHRSIWQRLSSKGQIGGDDSMVNLIDEILRKEPDFREVERAR